jgi:hypothetical protein
MGRRLAPIESCCDLPPHELLQVLQATPAGRLMKHMTVPASDWPCLDNSSEQPLDACSHHHG